MRKEKFESLRLGMKKNEMSLEGECHGATGHQGSKGCVSVMSQWLCVSKASVQVGTCKGESKVGKLG